MVGYIPEIVSEAEADEAARWFEKHPPIDGRHQYVVGAFSRSITFYRQQIRALNFVYALRHRSVNGTPRLAPGSHIAVVGAGAFGLTVSSAGCLAGYRVTILERAQQPLMLQSGCTTRWLHPRSYDWPAPGSQIRDARLPILNWTAARAAEVADTIKADFNSIKQAHPGKLETVYDVRAIKVRDLENSYRLHYTARDRVDDIDIDAVVYATGFGTDDSSETMPYWRNDHLGQPSVSGEEKMQYCISGTGDGGLVDVLRLRLLNFRQDRILQEIFEQPIVGSDVLLHHQLQSLRTEVENNDVRKIWQLLEERQYRHLADEAITRLRKLLRTDTSVRIEGLSAGFDECLANNEASFGNSLLVYLLYRINDVTYDKAEPAKVSPNEKSSATLPIEKVGLQSDLRTTKKGAEHVIVRHGTDRMEPLKAAGLSTADIEGIKKRHDLHDWPAEALYPPGWWDRFTQPQNAQGGNNKFVAMEHVPKELYSLATVFVQGLAAAIEAKLEPSPKNASGFRLALHCLRESSREGKPTALFHQVTDYAGHVEEDPDRLRGLGRTFPADGGTVGFACKSGRIVVADGTLQETEDFVKKINLDETGAKEVRPKVKGFLAYPLLSPDGTRVMMVLFLDVVKSSFLDDSMVKFIHFACCRFVKTLEMAVENGAIRAVPDGYEGYPILTGADLATLLTKHSSKVLKFNELSPSRFKKITVPDFEASDAGVYGQSRTLPPS